MNEQDTQANGMNDPRRNAPAPKPAAAPLSEWEQFKADRREANKRLEARLRGWTHMTGEVPTRPPERKPFDPRPKPERRAANALARAAGAHDRQKRDEATRRVEVLSHSRIEAMSERTKKQRRRKEKARKRFEARLAAVGEKLVARAVTA